MDDLPTDAKLPDGDLLFGWEPGKGYDLGGTPALWKFELDCGAWYRIFTRQIYQGDIVL